MNKFLDSYSPTEITDIHHNNKATEAELFSALPGLELRFKELPLLFG